MQDAYNRLDKTGEKSKKRLTTGVLNSTHVRKNDHLHQNKGR